MKRYTTQTVITIVSLLGMGLLTGAGLGHSLPRWLNASWRFHAFSESYTERFVVNFKFWNSENLRGVIRTHDIYLRGEKSKH